MSLQRITQQPKTGSGVVSDEQAIAASLAEQTVARQSAGTVVKSPSASAHGSERVYVPSYSRKLANRFRLARESMMRTIRMEAERKNEQRACADKLATDLRVARVWEKRYKYLALMGWIIVPVMWVVTR